MRGSDKPQRMGGASIASRAPEAEQCNSRKRNDMKASFVQNAELLFAVPGSSSLLVAGSRESSVTERMFAPVTNRC